MLSILSNVYRSHREGVNQVTHVGKSEQRHTFIGKQIGIYFTNVPTNVRNTSVIFVTDVSS